MKKNYKTIFFLFILMQAFLIIGCPKKESENFTPVLNVYCIIRNDVLWQESFISRTYGIDEDSSGYDLGNVIAVLSAQTHCDTFEQIHLEIFYTIDTSIMVPGEKYHLKVSADNLDTLVGEMTACGSFRIIYPQDGDTLAGIDSLIFTRGKGIKSFTITLLQYGAPYYEYYEYLFQEDSIIRVRGDDIQLPAGLITIKIEEADSNFTNYKFLYNDDELPQFGVSGGIGVFGSAWVQSVNVYMNVEK